LNGSRDAEIAVFEVDEAALPALVGQVAPRVLTLGNLFRDQLDRYGEMELIADRWRAMLAGVESETRVIVNADDPILDDAASIVSQPLRYGIDDPTAGRVALDEAADSTFCVRCGSAYGYSTVYYGHLGSYHCPTCGHARGALDFAASDIHLDGVRGTRFRLDGPDGPVQVQVPLPGLYNVSNALAALATASALGVPTTVAAERLAATPAAFGRFERVTVGDHEAVVLLIKNPAGANEALRTIAEDLSGATLILALNDRIADGRDVSWIWDVDFEVAVRQARRIICSGDRAADMALRMRYADVPSAQIEVIEAPLEAFDEAIGGSQGEQMVYVLPTYTAMLELRRALAQRGIGRAFWEDGG
jgi:UDP-N-acetylmuramyl tripeptide synthase